MKRLRLMLGIVLLGLPLWFVDWCDAIAVAMGTDPTLICFAVLILSINMPLSSGKWLLLLRVVQVRASFLDALRAYWIGAFFSNYLPSNMGGDIVRFFVLRCEGRRAEAASSIVIERLTGLFVLLLLALVALIMRPQYFDTMGIGLVLWLLTLGSLGAILAVFFLERPLRRLLAKASLNWRGLTGKLVRVVDKMAQALAEYRKQPRAILVALSLSLPFYGILIVFQYLVLEAVGTELSLLEVSFIAPMIPLISVIPVSVNGLGMAEGAFVLFYVQAGVPLEAAVAAALLRRVLALIVSLAGGLFWIGLPRQIRYRRAAPSELS
ncbi:MAG: lysylphosphatidylglycerol synthase transmembrane domain-containing protein [Gammaproteobacteria bacterium]